MNTTVVMVSFKSEHLIEQNIKRYDENTKILIIENSQNLSLKNEIEKKYKNVEVVLNKNLEQNSNAQDLKLRESAKQLEGVFLQYFLKPMEEAMTKSISGESNGPNLVKNMFTQVMSDALSKNNNIGLSDQIYDHLKRAQINQNNNSENIHKNKFIKISEK